MKNGSIHYRGLGISSNPSDIPYRTATEGQLVHFDFGPACRFSWLLHLPSFNIAYTVLYSVYLCAFLSFI